MNTEHPIQAPANPKRPPNGSRRHAGRLLPLVMVLLLKLSATVQAQCYSYTTNDNTITITGMVCIIYDVYIPDIIADLPVTRIGNDAFRGRGLLYSVRIPDSVTSIGDGAFAQCVRMRTATIGNSVTPASGTMRSGNAEA
jgi:hypothetical protein